MMEETATISDSNDEFLSERMTPLGANSTELIDNSGFSETERLKMLEDEQEQLNASLMALTTHFARVQFRLRQIVNAPNEVKEDLIKELEEFASRGCPDLNQKSSKPLIDTDDTTSTNTTASTTQHEQIIEEQRLKQKKLIEELKNQLQDLESYAYQTGDLEMPSTLVMEKQKVIIDELKDKINLPLDNINKLTNEDLKRAVDHAISQIVNPVKVKEQLVNQLKTQIADLERFIQFLQGEVSSPGPYGSQCKCPVHGSFTFNLSPNGSNDCKDSACHKNTNSNGAHASNLFGDQHHNHHKTVDMLKKILTIMQIFAITQFGCGTKSFEKNVLKKTATNHWGDLRANLEIAIGKVIEASKKYEFVKQTSKKPDDEEYDSDEVNNNERVSNSELMDAVQKELFQSLRDLMQHGLVETSHSTSLVPAFAYACFPIRARETQHQMHIWDLFIKYYEIKHGKEFSNSPARKLSQSFNLNVVGGRVITLKQALLSTIESVLNIHKQYKSNKDSQFKTFLCIALNEKKLVVFIKQLLKTTVLIENYYQTWSYVKCTGFDDALKSLDQLKNIQFNLPIDRSVRHLNKIKDLF